jgi:hypothetical protein
MKMFIELETKDGQTTWVRNKAVDAFIYAADEMHVELIFRSGTKITLAKHYDIEELVDRVLRPTRDARMTGG